MVTVKCINYEEENPICRGCRLHHINRECVYFYPTDPNDNNECSECLHYNKNDNEWPCSNCYNNTPEEYNKLKHRNGFEFCDEATAERKMEVDAEVKIPETENTKEAVNHPEHYQGPNECIDVMRALFGDAAVMNFCKCNAFKYRFRSGMKNGQEDIKKAEWYETYLIKMQKGFDD